MKDDYQISQLLKNNSGEKQNFKEELCELNSEIKKQI